MPNQHHDPILQALEQHKRERREVRLRFERERSAAERRQQEIAAGAPRTPEELTALREQLERMQARPSN